MFYYTFFRDLVGSAYANDPNINSFFFLSNQNDATPAAGEFFIACQTIAQANTIKSNHLAMTAI